MPSHTCLFAYLLIFGLATCEKEKEIRSLMHDTDVNYRHPSSAGNYNSDDDFEVEFIYPKKDFSAQDLGIDLPVPTAEAVRRLWGVPDTRTFVGKIFSYPIPEDAFQGDVLSYQLPNLPSWLSFNSRTGYMEGVPSISDLGAHYITIRAEGKDKSTAKDAFAIEVIHMPKPELLKEQECLTKDDLTVLSILIDSPLSNILPRDRVQLMQRIAGLFMAKANQMSLSSAPLDYDPLSDDSTIMAGPGSAKSLSGNLRPKSKNSGIQDYTQVQWVIGCHGQLAKGQLPQVNNVESSSANGKLQRLIGFPILGWHVAQSDPSTKRVRRDVETEGSADGFDEEADDYTDDEFYDYEYEVIDGVVIGANNVHGEEEFGATPVYQEGSASTYDETPTYISPVFRPVPLSTPAYIPVKPTRVVVDASPTVALKTVYPFGKSESDLESSLLVHPTKTNDLTTPLTVTMPAPTMPSETVEASAVPDLSETIEYGVKNMAPRVVHRIEKMAWIAGMVYRVRIPKNTFSDLEDGDSRNLTLILKDESSETFTRDSWIQFDPTKQEVYALPLEDNIGNYDFRLEAMDKERKIAKALFTVSVRQHHGSRNFHHKFTAVMELEKKYRLDFAYTLDWQIRAVKKIAALFLDSKVSNIAVSSIDTNPVQISWTNLTLIDSSATTCPTEELEAINKIMRSGIGNEPSRSAQKVFKPEFNLKSISAEYYRICVVPFRHSSNEIGIDKSVSPITEINSPPIFSNQVDNITAVAGILYRYKVPDTTCYDREDGSSHTLTLQLFTDSMMPPPPDSWLQFDVANKEFYGLPLYDDAGKKEYILKCIDSKDESVIDSIKVEVLRLNLNLSSHAPVHFSLTIDEDFSSFMTNSRMKAKLIDRIGIAFGDRNASHIVVDSIKEGSVVVKWYNGSLPSDPCPHDEIQRLRDIMTDDNEKLRKKFKSAFLPDFIVTDGKVRPSGNCVSGDTPVHQEEQNIGPPGEEEVSSTDEDYLLTFIVPAVIIAVMLLLAALIACCLYKRRRYGKMSMTDDRTFVSKGIPIIFAEELDDQRGTEHAKSPVIMKEEKPPLPPPPQSSMDDAPYHPPPPFTSNGSQRNERPNLPPAYRKPPTYVPP